MSGVAIDFPSVIMRQFVHLPRDRVRGRFVDVRAQDSSTVRVDLEVG